MTEGGYKKLWKNIIPDLGYKRMWKIITSCITIEKLPEEDNLQLQQRKMGERIMERHDVERKEYSKMLKQCQDYERSRECVVCVAKKEKNKKI